MPSVSDGEALRAFARLGWRCAAAERLATAARCALNVLILAIFWAFWKATPLDELGRRDLTPERLIWYLAITEWIVFATGMPYRDIEEDIRSGSGVYRVLRFGEFLDRGRGIRDFPGRRCASG